MNLGNTKIKAINFPVVANILGWLLMMEAVLMILPCVTSLCYSEGECARAFLISMVITGTVGAAMTFGIRPARTNMRIREGLLLTGLVWVVLSIFGCMPFVLTGVLPNVVDAFFESISGFTTTGATVIRDVEVVPRGILLWRSSAQWLGGMGIILFTLAVLPFLNHSGGLQLFNAETTGITHDKLRPRVSQTAKSLWGIYCIISLVLFVLLWLGPMDWFDALNHTLTTTSTGGFSTKNASIAHYDSLYIVVVITIFMFVCGINFSLLYKAMAEGDFKSLFKNDIFRWYAGIVITIGLIISVKVVMVDTEGDDVKIFAESFFNAISLATSTGLGAIDYEKYGALVAMLGFALMIFGGSAGSTAGGAKIDRLVLFLKNAGKEIYQILHPNSISVIRINGKAVTNEAFLKTVAFLTCYFVIYLICAVVFTAFDMPTFDAFFTSMSMISNIGFGYGATGTNGSYAHLNELCKCICCFEMLIGRLELFTVLVLFSKGFWRN